MAILKHVKSDGAVFKLEFTDKPLTLGRGKDADVQILDKEISRIHCAIRIWEEACIVKDLGSTNGTFVNDVRVNLAKLQNGDHIRLGNTTFEFMLQKPKGTATILRDVEEEIAGGKGFSTILREVVTKNEPNPP